MALRGFRDRSHWEGFSQRFGLGAPVHGRAQHLGARRVGGRGAGVGAAGERAAGAVSRPCRWSLTTGTATGRARARAVFRTRVDVRYVPIDLPGSVRRFFQRVNPVLAVILETEIWPNLYHRCGRLGDSAGAGQRAHLAALGERVIAGWSGCSARRCRTASSSRRRASRTPSASAPSAPAPSARTWSATSSSTSACRPTSNRRARSCAACSAWTGRCGWRAAPTRRKKTCSSPRTAQVRARYAQALLVLVPRHPPRFGEVAAALQGAGRELRDAHQRRCRPRGNTEVFLVDTLGELLRVLRRRRTWPSSAAAWCPSAATTCSSPPRSGCRCWPGPTISIPRTSRGCWWNAARCASCTTRRDWPTAIGELLAESDGAHRHGRERTQGDRGQSRRGGAA